MSDIGDVGAVVLLRTIRKRNDITRVFGAIEGMSRVEGVRGPYELVIHATGPGQVEAIEEFPGVITAEVCWLSPRSQGGAGWHDRD